VSPRPALALALLLGGAGRAAAEEGEWQLGVEPAYAMAYRGAPVSGGGGLLRLGYAPRDSLTLQLLGGVTAHPEAAGPLLGFSAGAGLVYVFDVVRVVPFFECFAGLLGTRDAAGDTRLRLGLGVGLGADYLVSRRLSVGVAARWQTALTDLSGLPLYLTAGPRLTVRFTP
jgi:hypothetical protein